MSLGSKLTAFAAALVLTSSAFAEDELCPNLGYTPIKGAL